MSVKITIDSACDIQKEEADQEGLVFLPLKTNFSGTVYEDGITLSREKFYELLAASNELPSTSQVTPYEYQQAYETAIQEGHEVLVITLSSKLSGTYQSAVNAAKEVKQKITIVDSENASIGEQILVKYAIKCRDEGMNAQQIGQELEKMKKRVVLLGVVDTLEYLVKGGRLSKTAAFAGSMLNIKPILSLVDGEIVSLGKAHGTKQSCSHLNNLIAEKGGIDYEMPLLLGYSGTDDAKLQTYIQSDRQLWIDHFDTLPIGTVGSTIGTHAGPGAILLAFFVKNM